MSSLLNNLVVVQFTGEGHYSGHTEVQTLFMSKESFNKHEDTFLEYTPIFRELDGKHSEVYGEVDCNLVEDVTDLCAAINTAHNNDDNWMMLEDCLVDDESIDCSEIIAIGEWHNQFKDSVSMETTIKYLVGGVEVATL